MIQKILNKKLMATSVSLVTSLYAALASAQAAGGVTVSSVTAGTYTFVSRDTATTNLIHKDYAQYYLNGFQAFRINGWSTIPNSDFAEPNPDSAVVPTPITNCGAFSNGGTYVAARFSNNNNYVGFTRRGYPTGSGQQISYPSWDSWTYINGPNAVSVGGPAIVFTYNPCANLRIFARHADGTIWQNTLDKDSNLLGWQVLGSINDFVSDPKAAIYGSNRVAVCARRASNQIWCTYDEGNGFSAWATINSTWTFSSGVGLYQSMNPGNNLDLYAIGGDLNLWANDRLNGTWNGFWKILHTNNLAGDPDATTFADVFNNGNPSRLVCVGSLSNTLNCNIWNSTNGWRGWFSP